MRRIIRPKAKRVLIPENVIYFYHEGHEGHEGLEDCRIDVMRD
jgi:hypothetical protein